MSTYAWFNLVIAAAVLPASFYVAPKSRRMAGVRLAIKSATLMTLTAYPWDYFGIQQGAWRYPLNPGFTIYGVPLNDLVLIWTGTCFSTSIFYAVLSRPDRRDGHSEAKDTNQ